MPKLQQFESLCRRVKTIAQADRLWNWADNQDEPEGYWKSMMSILPWAFSEAGCANSIRF